MSQPSITGKAYAKIILHAAKYPHLAVNGLLLGEKRNKSKSPVIVDAVPLFHQCLHVTPMAEIALIQVESRATKEDLQIVGYYCAAENYYDNSVERAPGIRVAEKVAELNNSAYLIMVDNRQVSMSMKDPALLLWQFTDGKWVKGDYAVHDARHTIDAVSLLLQKGAMKQLVDFDNHLDEPKLDWTNEELDKALDTLQAMDDDDDDDDDDDESE